MADVAKNTPPITNKTIPNVPVTLPVKYKAPNTNARIILIIRSAPPMFVDITNLFCGCKILFKNDYKQVNKANAHYANGKKFHPFLLHVVKMVFNHQFSHDFCHRGR
jgi:hypothetical protein